MKIKTDFITNSSSTCFVVMTKGHITLDEFINAVGIDANSKFQDIFKELYSLCFQDLKPLKDFIANDRWNKEGLSEEEYITQVCSKKTWERIVKAESEGFEIRMGRLHSDNNPGETYFCTTSFVIETDNLILDATNSTW